MHIQDPIVCEWRLVRNQLLVQWKRISAGELEETGPDGRRIAQLVARKYRISSDIVESYLHNFADSFSYDIKHAA